MSMGGHNGGVIKWKHFLRYWPSGRGIHRSSVNSPQKGQWHGALMFVFICAWTNGWVNNHDAGDLRRHRVHYDVTIMVSDCFSARPSRTTDIRLDANFIKQCPCCFFLSWQHLTAPLLCLYCFDSSLKFKYYFRWLNAKETQLQHTSVSFASSQSFAICYHYVKLTLRRIAHPPLQHDLPFRVASMPAVRYDLSGGLPTCLWLFIHQDCCAISCISKEPM